MGGEFPKPLKEGDRFGDYVVERLLGEGGMGAVYLVRAPDGSRYAVKVLHPGKMTHDLRRRFAREAEFAMKIQHKNLIRVYDVGEDPETGLCYIIMDYVSGGNLADRIKSAGRMSVAEAVSIVSQIAEGLDAAHNNGLVHRDVTPDNILFDADGTPKLADLGVAKFDDDHKTLVTMTGMIIGTPAYMSPEQLMDSHNIDARADIYSLGVVLYEMLAGKRPNVGSTAVELLAKAIKGEELPDIRTMRPDISAAVAHVLSLMCAAKPEGRPATSLAAAKLLQQAFDGSLVLPKKPPKTNTAIQAHKKRENRMQRTIPFIVLIAAGLELIILCAFGLKNWINDRKSIQNDSEPISDSIGALELDAKNAADTNVHGRAFNTMDSATASRNMSKGEADRNVRHAKVGGYTWFYTLENGEAVIWRGQSSYNSKTSPAMDPKGSGHVVVPAELDGHKVTVIGLLAFFRCTDIQSIEIPEGVRELREWAFLSCTKLTSVSLPKSLERIRANAFLECPALSHIDIGNCYHVSGASFVSCGNLASVMVSPSNSAYVSKDGALYTKDMGELVFFPRTRSSVKLPKTVRRIRRGAFNGCGRLREVSLPDGVEEIGASAFSYCSGLEVFNGPERLQDVGASAFRNCKRLRRVSFKKALRRIGSLLFDGCSALKIVKFEGDEPEIDKGASSVFGGTPVSLIVAVRRGSKGWNAPGTTVLPKKWPEGAFADKRAICFSDDVLGVKSENGNEVFQDGTDVNEYTEWCDGPSDMWFVEWDRALAEAKRTKRKLFVLKSGSDWCQTLNSDVFSNPEFVEFAKKNLVLVYLDDGSSFNPLSREQKRHNVQITSMLELGGRGAAIGLFTVNGKRLGIINGGEISLRTYMEQLKSLLKGKGEKIGNAQMLFTYGYAAMIAKMPDRSNLPNVGMEQFKVAITGVAVVEGSRRGNCDGIAFKAPGTHLDIPFGKKVVFRVEHDFPKGYKADICISSKWSADKRDNYAYFGRSPAGRYNGKGTAYAYLWMREHGKTCTLESVKITARSNPELEEYPNGWIAGITAVNLKFNGKNDSAKAQGSN